ncbi:MAG: cytidine deaminase [Elusimicrobia bacterium]|nr:cytidine deaminase [Elusimicrobiota bacterium]
MARHISKKYRKLIETAKLARKKAYCPYSRYQVGAAVMTESGRIFSGCNVENASYGLSICAERVAVFNAVARGERMIQAVAVVGKSARPCGACRQVMLEFSTKETDLLLVDLDPNERKDTVIRSRVYSMLPCAFDPLESGLLPQHPHNLLRRRRGPIRRRKRARRLHQYEGRKEGRR